MPRSLLSNALRYTARGGVLLGWRVRGVRLSIEIWDTGPGVPVGDRAAIFELYRQLTPGPRASARGPGLRLAIVRQLGELLDHRVDLRSRTGRGSVFSIEAMLSPAACDDAAARPAPAPHDRPFGPS